MVCQFCNLNVGNVYECPECGAVVKTAPARQKRPERELVTVINSDNYNGRYSIFKNPDSSLSCTCLSFLFQRGTQNTTTPFVTCKHIRQHLQQCNDGYENFVFTPPSEWQRLCLKKLGVEKFDHLTNDQAYFLTKDLLRGQGINYQTFKEILVADPKPSFLPLRYYGVEFEGGLGIERDEFKRRLIEAGIEAIVTGYDHTLHNGVWKVGRDSSVNPPNGLYATEVVSPKLSGAEGFQEVRKVLSLWNETLPFRNGSSERINGVNTSTGTHVHVDAKMFRREDLFRLALVWAKIEVPIVFYLVAPSRRNGRYCRQVDRQYLKEVFRNGSNENERYYSLNFQSHQRQGSVEFRVHNGTIDYNKIVPWIIFCVHLVDAVERGLTHEQTPTDLTSLLDVLGIKGPHPILKWVRESLIARYNYFKGQAERDGLRYTPTNIEGVVEELMREEVARRRRELESNYASRTALCGRDNSLADNTIRNLAAMRPTGVIMGNHFTSVGENAWSVPSRTGEGNYTVTLNPENDTLTCNCRGFRTHRHCYHSINLARHLWTQREIARLETV